MTTIAYKDGIMASDTQITRGDESYFGSKKIFEEQGVLFGIAGSAFDLHSICTWALECIDAGWPPDAWYYSEERPSETDSYIIVVDKKGVIWNVRSCDGKGVPLYEKKYESVGSGAAYALGAMHFGASAAEGVKTAMNYDVNSGGTVDWISRE